MEDLCIPNAQKDKLRAAIEAFYRIYFNTGRFAGYADDFHTVRDYLNALTPKNEDMQVTPTKEQMQAAREDVPDWEYLTHMWAEKFVNEQNLPYGAGKDSGKDKTIREAFKVYIRVNNLLKLIATQAYEEGFMAGKKEACNG